MRHLPTTRAAALVAVAAVVCVVHPGVGLTVLVAVLAATAVDAVRARPTSDVATRDVPPFVVRGSPATMRVAAAGDAGRGGDVVLTQPGTSALTVTGTAPGDLTVVAARRGRHELPPLQARRVGGLGLGAWSGPVTPAATIVAHPDVLAARRLARTAQQQTFEEESGRARGPLGLGTSFESLREYLPEDDVRLVNWKASARAGRPVVNQFRLEQSRDVVLLLDAGRLLAAPAPQGPGTLLDAAVDAATAIALTADAIGDRCGLVVYGEHVLAHLAPRTGGGRAVAGALSGVEPTMVDSDVETAFRLLPTKRSIVVVFTDLVDDVAAFALQRTVPVLGRRHQVVVVAPDDPALRAMVAAASSSADARAGYRATAAATLLEERARAAAVLRRSGASVTTGPPDRLAAVATRAYLDVKARARA